MFKLKSYLSQPYPANRNPILIIAVSSALVFFILAIFQPFGLQNIKNHKLLIIIGYTIVTTICMTIVSFVFPKIFTSLYEPENQTLGKNFLKSIILIALIGLGNFVYDCIIYQRPMYEWLILLYKYMIITFLVGIVPAFVSAMIIFNIHLKRNLKSAENLTKKIMAKKHNDETDKIKADEEIVLQGTTKESLQVFVDDIIYAEAVGNYVKFTYWNNGTVAYKTIRNTLQSLTENLKTHSTIIRVHRAFLVNTTHIKKVNGNSAGYKLSLKGISDEIPVSRSYIKNFNERL